jgi:hypothetical protein
MFKMGAGDADEGDVDNHQDGAESVRLGGAGAPSLPPRAAPPVPSTDVWVGVEAEPEYLHHQPAEQASAHASIFLLPTAAARVLATIGWFGGVLTTVLLMVALMPAFEDGETRNFNIPLDDGPWYGATLIVSTVVVYLGWLWWTLSAAFNVHRLAPRATSPWLPTSVYLIGPLIILAGLDVEYEYADAVVWLGCGWMFIGHLIVIASFRSTAGRIGASMDEFSKLLWLPLAWAAYRAFVITMLTFVEDQWKMPGLLLALGGAEALYLLGMAVATWRATESFDHACRRLNTRGLGRDLPSVDMVTAAIRQRALEGR